MMLTPAEVDRLVRLRLPLLVYVNGLLGLYKDIASVEDLMDSAHKDLAREHSRRLCESGAVGGWYAAFDGVVVAGGTSREDVERTVSAVVPEGSRDLVHLFHVKGGAIARVEPDDGNGGWLPSSFDA